MTGAAFHGYCVLGITMVYTGLFISASGKNLQEVCLSENFQADCSDGHVIMMLSALYGRMHVGRCARQGNIGCVADALRILDIRCSGRQQCDFQTPDGNLLNLKPCPPDAMPYLEAVYSCIPVISNPGILSECQTSGFVTLSGLSDGNVGSWIARNTRQGTELCPWIIEADEGKRINITMVDFGTKSTEEVGSTCDIYATISEHRSLSPTMICSGADREKVVYLSSSSRVELNFIDTIESGMGSQFLLKFSVIGCQDPPLNGNVLKQRTSHKAVLHCTATGNDQEIYCRGTSWDAHVKRCDDSDWDVFSIGWGTQQGMWIVLGIGIVIGIVFGLGLLFCGIMCFRRYRRHRDSHGNESPYDPHVFRGSDDPFYAKKDYGTPQGEMNYATYDRKASSQKPYMHVVNPVNRDVMLVGNTGTLKYQPSPTKAKDYGPIKYMDQDEPAYEKPR